MYSVSDETRKPIFEGVQGENEAREIQFDVTAWVEELGEGVCTATAKRPTDTTPYPVTVTRSGNVVTWKPNSTDTSIEGIGAFQLAFSINDVVAKTRIWNTKIAPSLVGAGDPPDPYDDWIQDLRDIAAETLTYSQNAENSADDAEAEKLESEAWAKGTKNGTPVPSTADQYENNSKYYSEESYKNAEAWAVGQRGGVDVPSTDPAYENNSKYWAEQSLANQYGAFIVKSASGDIASFNDGADDVPMKSLNVTITPKQSGSGDPSPSNVRPISGWTDADISISPYEQTEKHTITGKNLYNAPNNTYEVLVPCHIPAGSVITFSEKPNGSGQTAGFRYFDANKTQIDYWTAATTEASDGRKYRTVTIPSNRGDVEYVEFYGVTSGIGDFMIELGSTYTGYEPYGVGTPVPFGQTVYGGTVNPISGELTITRKAVDMGALTWSNYQPENNRFYALINDLSAIDVSGSYLNQACSCYTPTGAGPSSLQANYCRLYATGNYRELFICDTRFTDSAQIASALSGQTFVYELATPITVQLTPTQVATLLGTNNVWADCGDIAVEYRADPTLAYAELEALILENI